MPGAALRAAQELERKAVWGLEVGLGGRFVMALLKFLMVF